MPQGIAVVLVLLCIALVLFATERIPIDVVTILLVLALIITGVLTPGEAFSGFGNDIVATIAGLFILTGGLERTGVVDLVGRRLHRVAGGDARRLAFLVMIVAAACAAVMKNTTTTAMFVPVVLGLSQRTRVNASKLLMPLAFGAILGGTCTLIGTSTNLAVSSAITRYGLAPFSMFELSSVGLAIVCIGLLYMLVLGLWLLPDRSSPGSLADAYQIGSYVAEVLVLEDSAWVGKTLAEANLGAELDLTVLGVMRGKQRLSADPQLRIEPLDLLLVQGKPENVLRVKTEAGIAIKPDFKLSDGMLQSEELQLFEGMVMRSAEFIGRTLKELRFRQRFGVTVLAVNRHGEVLLSKISSVALRFGDVLLFQGTRDRVTQLASSGRLMLLKELTDQPGRVGKQKWALLALGIFLVFSLPHPWKLPLPVAVLSGVLVLLGTRTLRAEEIYRLVEWRLVVLIAGMISFGAAMEKTHADQYLADLIVHLLGNHGGMAVLTGFFVLTVLLTQPMSNQAAALVVVPVAVKAAVLLGLNPRAFAVAVTYAASCSFLTPLEPACVLIYTPGRYRFADFPKVGSILTVLVAIVVLSMVPVFWPLR